MEMREIYFYLAAIEMGVGNTVNSSREHKLVGGFAKTVVRRKNLALVSQEADRNNLDSEDADYETSSSSKRHQELSCRKDKEPDQEYAECFQQFCSQSHSTDHKDKKSKRYPRRCRAHETYSYSSHKGKGWGRSSHILLSLDQVYLGYGRAVSPQPQDTYTDTYASEEQEEPTVFYLKARKGHSFQEKLRRSRERYPGELCEKGNMSGTKERKSSHEQQRLDGRGKSKILLDVPPPLPDNPLALLPFLTEDTDQLWRNHCLRDFKNEKPEEAESWREAYFRLRDAREQRLLVLVGKISSAYANKPRGSFLLGRMEILGTAGSVRYQPCCCEQVWLVSEESHQTTGIPLLQRLSHLCFSTKPVPYVPSQSRAPFLTEDTDQLWRNHCLRDFKNEKPEEAESWREAYFRLRDAREQRLLVLVGKISSAYANKPRGRVTKVALMDCAAKPAWNVHRRRERLGTGGPPLPKTKCGSCLKNRIRPQGFPYCSVCPTSVSVQNQSRTYLAKAALL
ncbi:LOW QUALITY PROTEIN: elongin-A-like [Leptosomus discolor]